MTITCACENTYTVDPAPCPDGIEGCLVYHTSVESYDCPRCGTRNLPKLSGGIRMEVGAGVANVAGIARLDLYAADRDAE